MPHENDPEDLAPNFHGSYKESFEEEGDPPPPNEKFIGTFKILPLGQTTCASKVLNGS